MDEFADCFVSNTRMAARAVTRRYDAYLRPHGLTATQFALLGGISLMSGATVSAIAEARGFERTTLTRNLDRLEAMGLIVSGGRERGNGRIARLTPKGEALVRELVPLWRQAQAELAQQISPETFDLGLKVLRTLSNV